MTVKELKQFIERLPDDCQVMFEYDGPDAHAYLHAEGFIIDDDYKVITLTQGGDDYVAVDPTAQGKTELMRAYADAHDMPIVEIKMESHTVKYADFIAKWAKDGE